MGERPRRSSTLAKRGAGTFRLFPQSRLLTERWHREAGSRSPTAADAGSYSMCRYFCEMSRELAAVLPDAKQTLFANSRNRSTFAGSTYHVDDRGLGTIDRRACKVTAAAFEEGVLDTCEVVLANNWYAAFLAYYLGVRGRRVGRFPVVYVSPVVPQGEAPPLEVGTVPEGKTDAIA